MKTLLIPYAVNNVDKGWETNIDLYNNSTTDTAAVVVDVQNVEGVIYQTMNISIKPKKHEIVKYDMFSRPVLKSDNTSDADRLTIILSMPDDVYATPLLMRNEFFSILGVQEINALGK